MKILVFSDAHGYSHGMLKALKNHPDCALCVYLGDGTDDAEFCFEKYPSVPSIIVSGNREQYLSSFLRTDIYPYESFFEEGNVKFLAMHGHRPYDVKHDIGDAALYAKEKGADILLYGHTHEKDDSIIKTPSGEIRVINPGSVGKGYDASYAVLEIQNGVVLCGFAKA